MNNKHQVLSWGCNSFGQLGHGNCGQKTAIYQPKVIKYFNKKHIKIAKIECGGNHSLCLTQIGSLYSFGKNENYECGNGYNKSNVIQPELNKTLSNTSKIIDIKCGLNHNVAKTIHYEFYLWGINDFNQCLICDEKRHFVEFPTKFKGIEGISDYLDYKIIDIYPGIFYLYIAMHLL